jgi:hypothetical protein
LRGFALYFWGVLFGLFGFKLKLTSALVASKTMRVFSSLIFKAWYCSLKKPKVVMFLFFCFESFFDQKREILYLVNIYRLNVLCHFTVMNLA